MNYHLFRVANKTNKCSPKLLISTTSLKSNNILSHPKSHRTQMLCNTNSTHLMISIHKIIRNQIRSLIHTNHFRLMKEQEINKYHQALKMLATVSIFTITDHIIYSMLLWIVNAMLFLFTKYSTKNIKIWCPIKIHSTFRWV